MLGILHYVAPKGDFFLFARGAKIGNLACSSFFFYGHLDKHLKKKKKMKRKISESRQGSSFAVLLAISRGWPGITHMHSLYHPTNNYTWPRWLYYYLLRAQLRIQRPRRDTFSLYTLQCKQWSINFSLSPSFLTPTPYQIRNRNRRRAAVVGSRGRKKKRIDWSLPCHAAEKLWNFFSCIGSLKTTKKKNVTLGFGTFIPVTNLLYLLQCTVWATPL